MTKPVLFSVVIDRSGTDLPTDFILRRAAVVYACVQELLLLTGYEPQLSPTVDKVGNDWLIVFRVSSTFVKQLDLFVVQPAEQPTVQRVSAMVIEAAVVAIRRFRREAAGVIATDIETTLKMLRAADPRVIQALSKQPAKTLTVRNENGDFSLSLQSESLRTVTAESMPLIGFIRTVGYDEMTVLPVNRRSPAHVCIHPYRVRIPAVLQPSFDPVEVLANFVKPKVRLQLMVQQEDVVRRRDHVTFLLSEWPPS